MASGAGWGSDHESVRAGSGMVATPHWLATEAGRAVLEEGGNAIEAALAAAAAIAVVYPHMNQLGGDGFWLIRDPRGRVAYVEAAGFAGAKATPAFYREHGHEEVLPARGPLAALTVPGQIGGWSLALEAAAAFGGRMPLRRLLEPAIAHARTGFPVSASQNRLTTEKKDELASVPGFARNFLDEEGAVPEAGTVQRFERLADTLEHLSRAGLDDYYRGDIGREIAADLERAGSPVTREDLAAFHAVRRAPLHVKLSTLELWGSPPPTQGLATLMILAIFDRLGVKEPESFAHVHGLIEATKRAFLVRDRVVTDFERLTQDPADFLTKAAIDREVSAIDARRALPWPHKAAPGDTIWLGAADRSGLVVSYIQSIYWEFGSGLVLPATGVLMQNRGTSFSLDPTAVNPLEPGRRPFHTLNPGMAALADGRVVAFGCMGGEGQPQTNAAVMSRYALFGAPLGEAVARPRWLLGRSWGSPSLTLKLEGAFDGGIADQLARAGHEIEILPQPYADMMGHAGAVVLHPGREGLEGTHDPRSDGGALGV
ncbi:gamma-glutamyltranspeptidase/glutathione hydrolase [Angulomicrobium tetraedrale]|uniref:Gamma-glutamyltranspeptidase/glutathione hydrolase n=1 Tax=Ancylobacter tetraedralis TaxID=217068 RepID=A0A839Z4U5_9HYPH|nr:gamma-glutamyltransferase [Ancylobacter tetraedralis]MBB3770639.1 gamma-glutamyltranspeptidase/glutathione hydrolase [Ancylobacter tetraedralis]